MLNIPASTKIYVASEPVDIRKGMDALAGWVDENGLDVFSGHLFVFFSKRMTHVKILTWSRGGFVLLAKRLEQGRFRHPARGENARNISIDATELAMLLDGIDIQKVQRSKVWVPAPRGVDMHA